MILHKVSTSPFADKKLQQCLQKMADEDGLLLTQDAVYALLDKQNLKSAGALKNLYVLEDDMQARGITLGDVNATIVSYAGFVELSLQYHKVISW